MPLSATEEARRVMQICNACRYCEGYCAVFPAMELRRTFTDGDLSYLANLCHDCRGCYYACPYAPPHEFAVNVPKAFAKLRVETYEAHVWPRSFARLLRQSRLAAALITIVSVTVVLGLAFVFQNPSQILSRQLGAGAFYTVIPFPIMAWSAAALGLFAMAALALAGVRFWRGLGGAGEGRMGLRAFALAVRDASSLRYLGGAGGGCNYPSERFSHRRKWLHHLVFYGFLMDLASTTAAAFYHHILHVEAPYPLWSVPVVLGTVGGIGILLGTGGLLWLKRHSDRAVEHSGARGMDVAFLVLLLLTSLTGLILLALRETPAMGTLLLVHLGVVVGLFLTLPYGKFLHAVFRSAALVRYSVERTR